MCKYAFSVQNGGNKIIYLYSAVSMNIWKSVFMYLERYKKNDEWLVTYKG